VCLFVYKPSSHIIHTYVYIHIHVYILHAISLDSGFGGLGVACWPLVPKFADSNPVETVGFFWVKKSSARLPSEGK